jgi:D-lactate dehydrogenase (cytochrome)
MTGNLLLPWSRDYDDYLRDESRRIGTAESISFPTTEAEAVEAIAQVRARGGSITVQGARTGIVAGAVPQGGLALNLSRMAAIGDPVNDPVTGEARLTVQPGALLSSVQQALAGARLFFPPDPTETSASLGGMVACNASGAMTLQYGPTRCWVTGLRVVLADGDVLALRRGQCMAAGRAFTLRTEGGREIAGTLPAYRPPTVKSAAGYYVADDMDLLDLFIGMEGTLGIITEVELRLIRQPEHVIGVTTFLPSEEAALKFVRMLRGDLPGISRRPVAIEFFNADALNLLRTARAEHDAFAKIPALKAHYSTAVYAEFHGDAPDPLDVALMETLEAMLALGASDEEAWCATTPRELETLKAFRHATPEAVNLRIDQRKWDVPALTKLGTDMSVPDAHLEAVMALYRDSLTAAGLESVIFGHIGNNHLHVNILPRTMEEYDRGKALYLDWARQIVALGGSVAAEHGIGKLKGHLLELMYGEDAINDMRALKRLFDPAGMLSPGNYF